MKFCIVLSTRPEIIKLASLIKIFKQKRENFFLVNTNQHYTKIMSKVFFNHFNIPKPKYNINANSSSYISFFSKSLKEIGNILIKEKPNYLIVQGDTNTALAGCLAGSIYNRHHSDNKKIKIVHVESGLRSFDEKMPEEINRKIIDILSDILFVPTKIDMDNLKNENLLKNKKILKSGNTITDVVKSNLNLLNKNNILKKFQLKKRDYFLATLHRPESVDNSVNFKKIIYAFNKISYLYKKKIIFPVHPRTEKILKKFKKKVNKNIIITKPLEYIDFLFLMKNCRIIFTDSGGIQEESSILGIPCITTRTSTERQITLKSKVNIMTGYDQKKIIGAVRKFYNIKAKKLNLFGDGRVAEKIYKFLKK